MQHVTLLTLGLAAASSASLFKRQYDDYEDQTADYLQQVCYPSNATGYPDFNAPCVQTQLISIQCLYGAAGLQSLLSTGDDDENSNNNSNDEEDMPMLSNSTQRECVCQSQFWAAANGCNDFFKAHGASATDEDLTLDPSILASASSSYCAVTNTPTVGFDMFLYSIATDVQTSNTDSAASTASSSTFSDPIGNQTAVSLYYTPSITGSSAWVVAQATSSVSNNTVASGSSGSGSASSTESLATSNGQIIATAGASATTGSTSGSASGTASAASGSASTTAGSGAGKQEAAAVAGVIALAGIVALL